MSLPLATTTISVVRSPVADEYAEPYSGTGPGTWTVVVAGVRAVIDVLIGREAGREDVAGGEQTRTRYRLHCDPCDLNRLDVVRDERTGVDYRVVWLMEYVGPGPAPNVDHIVAGLELVEGLV